MRDEIDLVGLGLRVKAARKQCGLTQEQLASLISVDTSHIGRIETACTGVSLATLLKIAKALHVSLDYLLADSLSPQDETAHDTLPSLDGLSAEERRVMLDTLAALRASLITHRPRS